MGYERGQAPEAVCQKWRGLPSTESEPNIARGRARRANADKPGEKGKKEKHVPESKQLLAASARL